MNRLALTLVLLLAVAGCRPRPGPDPSPPDPPPAPGPAPADLREAIFARANVLRQAKGVRPFILDDRLAASAQSHADDLVTKNVQPHEGMVRRLKAAGWPFGTCTITRRSMQANYTEGVTGQSDAVTAASVEILLAPGPRDAHYQDFYDPKITRVGVGVGQGGRGPFPNHVVLDYGIDCDKDK